VSRRALVVERPGTLVLAEREHLSPGPGEVVVRPAYCGVCGSDLELLGGEIDPAFVRYPLTLGHEWAGTIFAVGSGVEGLSAGQRCVGEGIIPCGACSQCLAGASNVCEVYDEIGFTREGAAGDELLVPAGMVHVLDPSVSLLDAALAEPASVVLTGLEKAAPLPRSRVLVIGDGTIALLAAMLVQLFEPSRVEMVGRRPEQAQLAQSLGVERFAIDDPPAPPYDLVIEAAGSPAAIETAARAARRGGRVLLLGLPPMGTTITLPADLLVNNDLALIASFGATHRAWVRIVALLAKQRLPLGRLVTHRFQLENFDDAFAALSGSGEGARGKVMLEVGGG
jgi:2-desacetyl-2-hydroxyethyl bacteriochlorophyllide A dehydrogenase